MESEVSDTRKPDLMAYLDTYERPLDSLVMEQPMKMSITQSCYPVATEEQDSEDSEGLP